MNSGRNTTIIATHKAIHVADLASKALPQPICAFCTRARGFLMNRLCRFLMKSCPRPDALDLWELVNNSKLDREIFSQEMLNKVNQSLIPYYVMKHIMFNDRLDVPGNSWEEFDRVYGGTVRNLM